ncbi:hypothetical protein ACFT5C_27940 [Streptomyces sp. NPDC057116]|uniref:hypothetical protein n=1 Tax=Streptomyces sp. NPDC057116 TaxID=3346023 RepID=UPI0036276A6A
MHTHGRSDQISPAARGSAECRAETLHDEILVAEESEHQDQPPVLHRHRPHNDGSNPRSVPGAHGLLRVAAVDASGVSPDKAVNRALRRIDALGEFFGLNTPEAGSDALVLESRRDQANKAVFAGARFPRSRHRLFVKGTKGMAGSVTDADHIEIITGVCLFSTRLHAIDEHGGNIPLLRPGAERLTDRLRRITVDSKLSLYEYETVMRLSRVIADLVGALPPAVPLTITIDVPRVQYYLYILDAFEDGLASADVARHWFHLVDDCHSRLQRLFEHRLRSALAVTDRDVTIRTASGLAPLAGCLHEAVTTGNLPQAGDLFSRMVSTDASVWRLLQPLHPPADYEHLIFISHAVEYLRAAGVPGGEGGGLCMAVDDYTERQILDHSQRLGQRLGQPEELLPSLGIYSAEALQALTPAGEPDPLYLAGVGRYAVEHTGRPVDLFHLVDRLYG